MVRKTLAIAFSLVFVTAAVITAQTVQSKDNLTAAEIADKNVSARGGLREWRAVNSLSFTGKLGAGGDQRMPLPDNLTSKQTGGLTPPHRLAQEAQLPFDMKMERPRKVRIELQFNGQTAVQVYDGVNGWKLRPFLNRMQVESYTPDELKAVSAQPDIDGFLVDYKAKGTQIELSGIDKVDDHDAYNLKLTLKSGRVVHVWIDSQTFLEAKIEAQPRELDGKMHPVEIYYRDYRAVSGLQIPFVLETRVLPLENVKSNAREVRIPTEKIIIDKVLVNSKLDASLFTKPQIETDMAIARH